MSDERRQIAKVKKEKLPKEQAADESCSAAAEVPPATETVTSGARCAEARERVDKRWNG